MREFAPFVVIGTVLCFLCAVYLYLVCPHIGKNPMRAHAFMYHYAHRGLHGVSVPENSLAAFRLATKQSYGIELDVRLTRDFHPVIFHDENAMRMCGVNKCISELTLQEVRTLRLLQTDEPIPPLQEALDTIKGSVPILVELKSAHSRKIRHLLVDNVLAVLKDYPGNVCMESFDPRIMYLIRKKAPHIPRGQLVMKSKGIHFYLLTHLLVLFLSRPHFIACEKQSTTFTTSTIARLFHPVMISWTIRSAAEWQAVNHISDLMVFEAFLPQAGNIFNDPRNSERGE